MNKIKMLGITSNTCSIIVLAFLIIVDDIWLDIAAGIMLLIINYLASKYYIKLNGKFDKYSPDQTFVKYACAVGAILAVCLLYVYTSALGYIKVIIISIVVYCCNDVTRYRLYHH